MPFFASVVVCFTWGVEVSVIFSDVVFRSMRLIEKKTNVLFSSMFYLANRFYLGAIRSSTDNLGDSPASHTPYCGSRSGLQNRSYLLLFR